MSDLDDRYGRNRSSHTPRWLIGGVAAVLTLGVIGFWVATAFTPSSTIETQTGGFHVVSDSEVRVTARVSVQPGTPLACVVEAQNSVSSVVGYKVIELPAATQQHQAVEVSLATTQPADQVEIRECWVPSQH